MSGDPFDAMRKMHAAIKFDPPSDKTPKCERCGEPGALRWIPNPAPLRSMALVCFDCVPDLRMPRPGEDPEC